MSVTLADLQPGYIYMYVIFATNAAGRTERGANILQTSPPGAYPEGSPGKQYEAPPASQGELELIKQEAEHIAARAEAERQQHPHEHEEQVAKEDAVRYASEAAALKRREEEEATAQLAGSVVLAGNAITVRGGGVSLVKLECLGSASCHGKLTLTAKSASDVNGKKKPARTAMIGTTSFSIPGDETTTVKVNLDAAGLTLLKADHGRCNARLALLELAPGPQNTRTTTVQLAQRKGPGKTKKGSPA